MAKDYYKSLGVSKGASVSEIKRAYRRLARKLHPDVTGDDKRSTDRFKEITEAYEVLSDAKRRRTYDVFGAADAHGSRAPDPPFQAVTQMVSELFSRGARKVGPQPGVDVEHVVRISLAEALRGVEKTVEVTLLRACDVCSGRGYPADKPPEPCLDCAGTGQRPGGFLPIGRVCARCEGVGTVRRYTCKACAGEGVRDSTDRLKVTFPAGVDDQTRLRMKGRGAAGLEGGAAGDLYVVVDLIADERFERSGLDLFVDVTISLKLALLGGSVEVVLPDGNARMNIPAGTQGGQVFRLRGKGFASMTRGAKHDVGDVMVTAQLKVPTSLSDEARAAVEALAKLVPGL